MRQDKIFLHNLKNRENNKNFEHLILSETDIVKPIIQEKFLKDYMLGLGDAEDEFRMYCRMFDTASDTSVRMILIRTREMKSYDEIVYMRNEVQCCFESSVVLLNVAMTKSVVLIIKETDTHDYKDILKNISVNVNYKYGIQMISVFSHVILLADIAETFNRINQCMRYSFYYDDTEVMYEDELNYDSDSITINPEYSGIVDGVSNGDKHKTSVLLDDFFCALEKKMPCPAVTKTYCLELYVCIIRCCDAEEIDTYMKGILSIQNGKNFEEIKSFITEKAMEIVKNNAPKNINIYSSLIKDTIRIIDENIGNEKLSLRWIAGTILYTNVDYLGKIFKRETGMNFSHYVMEKRMELAKELIMGGKKDRIYEVAEKVGYGSNSQYFSQVFKKYTGISPLEYKEITRQSSKK